MLDRLTNDPRRFRLGSALFAGALFMAIGYLVVGVTGRAAVVEGVFFALLQYLVIAPQILREVRERREVRSR